MCDLIIITVLISRMTTTTTTIIIIIVTKTLVLHFACVVSVSPKEQQYCLSNLSNICETILTHRGWGPIL